MKSSACIDVSRRTPQYSRQCARCLQACLSFQGTVGYTRLQRSCVCVCVCVHVSVWASLSGSCVFAQADGGQGKGLSMRARVWISRADCERQEAIFCSSPAVMRLCWICQGNYRSHLRDSSHFFLLFFFLLHLSTAATFWVTNLDPFRLFSLSFCKSAACFC